MHVIRVTTANLGLIGSTRMTFIEYKQTNKQTKKTSNLANGNEYSNGHLNLIENSIWTVVRGLQRQLEGKTLVIC